MEAAVKDVQVPDAYMCPFFHGFTWLLFYHVLRVFSDEDPGDDADDEDEQRQHGRRSVGPLLDLADGSAELEENGQRQRGRRLG